MRPQFGSRYAMYVQEGILRFIEGEQRILVVGSDIGPEDWSGNDDSGPRMAHAC